MCSLQQWYANQYPRCPFVQAMTSRVTGSSRGTAESGRAWPACCPAGTRTTSFPSRVTIPRLPSCILHDLLREVLDDDFLLQTHIFFALPCLSLPASLLNMIFFPWSFCVAGYRHHSRLKQAPGSAACCIRKDRRQLRRKVKANWHLHPQ